MFEGKAEAVAVERKRRGFLRAAKRDYGREKEDILQGWLKLAAKIKSVDGFMQSEEMWEKGYV